MNQSIGGGRVEHHSGLGAELADLGERGLVEVVGCALAGLVCGTVGVQQRGGYRGGPELALGVGVGDRPQIPE